MDWAIKRSYRIIDEQVALSKVALHGPSRLVWPMPPCSNQAEADYFLTRVQEFVEGRGWKWEGVYKGSFSFKISEDVLVLLSLGLNR